MHLIHPQVANAIGAALGMVSGRSDRIESISQIISTIESKDGKSEDDLNAIARDLAVQKGVAVATKAARSKGCIILRAKWSDPLIMIAKVFKLHKFWGFDLVSNQKSPLLVMCHYR